MKQQILLGELTLSSTEAPNEFLVLKKGENPSRKGIIVFDEVADESVNREFATGGVDLPIDYDHAMADDSTRVADRVSAGWFKVETREGDLYAAPVTWTDRGRASVESKEWRYTSLWGEVEPLDKDGKRLRLTRLLSVSLVNRPATLNTSPLVANEGHRSESSTMEQDKTLELTEKNAARTASLSDVASELGCEAGQIKGALKALQLKADKADKLDIELNDIKSKAEADKKDALISKLSDEGKLPPAQHEWAMAQTFENLAKFGENAPVVAPTTKVESAKVDQPSTTLSEETLYAAKLLGTTALLQAPKA